MRPFLRNVNQYDKAVQEEFEHLITMFSNNIRTHHGTLTIDAGSTQGFSPLPFTVNRDRAILINNGATNGGGFRIKFSASNNQIEGNRDTTTNTCTIDYIVQEQL